jgi:hypothetical protein
VERVDEDVARSGDLKKITGLLEECVRILARQDGITAGTILPAIGSKFAEFWVANHLIEYPPQMGKNRNKRGADIFLRRIKKRIEVKYSTLRPVWKRKYGLSDCNWGWAFGDGKQFLDKRFDFCVLVAATETGTIETCFVIPVQDFLDHMKKRYGVYPEAKGSYFAINLFRAPEDYASWKQEVGECPLEDILNKHRERYENNWNLVR